MYFLCSKNKAADQVRHYCTVDLCLCFRRCKKQVFSWHNPFVTITRLWSDCWSSHDLSFAVFLCLKKKSSKQNEPRCEKICLRSFRQGLIQTGLYKHRRWLEAWNFGFRKKRNCTIYVAKTKALISCMVTAQLICAFVFAYALSRFSHDVAQI